MWDDRIYRYIRAVGTQTCVGGPGTKSEYLRSAHILAWLSFSPGPATPVVEGYTSPF